MTQQLNRLRAMDAPDGGMTLALPESEVEKLLPSLNPKTATIELSDLMKIIAQHMRGTEFYANGNPVLNRLALRSRARELITAINQEAVAAPQPAEVKAAPQPAEVKVAAPQRQAKAAPQPAEVKAAPPPRKAKAAAPRQHQAKAAPQPAEVKAAPPPRKVKAAAPRQRQAKAAPRPEGEGK
jgi:hypothetical protein